MKFVDGVCRLPKKCKGVADEKWPTIFAGVPHVHSNVSSDRGTLGRVVNIEHCERNKLPFIIVYVDVLKKEGP